MEDNIEYISTVLYCYLMVWSDMSPSKKVAVFIEDRSFVRWPHWMSLTIEQIFEDRLPVPPVDRSLMPGLYPGPIFVIQFLWALGNDAPISVVHWTLVARANRVPETVVEFIGTRGDGSSVLDVDLALMGRLDGVTVSVAELDALWNVPRTVSAVRALGVQSLSVVRLGGTSEKGNLRLLESVTMNECKGG